jgi:hypothetical protein
VALGPLVLVVFGVVLGCVGVADATLGIVAGWLYCTGLATGFEPGVGAFVAGLAAKGASEL